MRYNISYSVDEDKLMLELYQIIDNRWTNNPKICGQQVGIIKNNLVGGNIPTALSAIEEMRRSMFDFDAVLDDVSGILRNYLVKGVEPVQESLDGFLDSLGAEE